VHWEVCSKIKAEEAVRTVEQALQKAKIKVNAKSRLLSDNGLCYLSGELKSYLSKRGVEHTRGKHMHPQPQGKIERYRKTMKNRSYLNTSIHQKNEKGHWSSLLIFTTITAYMSL
jgi:putative transposase